MAEAPEAIDGTAEEVALPTPAEAAPDPEEIQSAPDVYRRMELEDERLVMEELQGRALDVMLYSFESSGKAQTGLSVVGAVEGVNTMNRRGYTRIRISGDHEPRFEECEVEGEPAIRCAVYAEDLMHGSGVWAVAEQPLKMKKGSKRVPDPFAYRKALSKAQRNAFVRLIPVELIEYLKAQYRGEGRVKVIPGADRPDYEAPPALTDEPAKEKLARMRELYDEIKAIDRLVMPPGQFNAIVMQSQHDHDRLDEAIAHLEAFLDSEKSIAAVREDYRGLVDRETFEREVGKLAGLSQQRRLGALRSLATDAGSEA